MSKLDTKQVASANGVLEMLLLHETIIMLLFTSKSVR